MESTWEFQLHDDKNIRVENPAGYNCQYTETGKRTRKGSNQSTAALKQRKAWEIAKSPGKSILTTAIFAWMAGSTLNIFSIMITAMMLFNPLKSMFSVNSAFSKFSSESVLPQKFVFVLLNLVCLCIGVYKLNSMDLLPTAEDWITYSFIQESQQATGTIL